MELSRLERKLLLALREIGECTPEELVEKHNWKEKVEVMNAASWLHTKNLVEIRESVENFYSLDKEGKRYAKINLPETRVLSVLKEKKEILVESLKDIVEKWEVPIALTWLRKKKWAGFLKVEGITKILITRHGEKAKSVEEDLLRMLLKKEMSENDIEDKESLNSLLKRKNVIKKRVKRKYFIKLTEKGKKISETVSLNDEEITQITPELLRRGGWRGKKIRGYDIHTFVPRIKYGKFNPVAECIEKIRRIFLSMGFKEMHGNFVENCFWNMDVLFIPQDHPARDLQDTFYLSKPSTIKVDYKVAQKVKEMHEHGGDIDSTGWGYNWSYECSQKAILRTHTTVNTIRYVASHAKHHIKVFTVGRVFRREAVDSTHLPEFYQIEGIVMEKNASFSMLIGILKEFYRKMGFEEVRVRPGYFPYTEPSLEVEVKFENKWLELGGAGIFRPEVVEPFGVRHPVLAWGLGLERLLMMKYNLKDMRLLYYPDLKYLEEIPI